MAPVLAIASMVARALGASVPHKNRRHTYGYQREAWGIIHAARAWTAGQKLYWRVINNENYPSECDGGSVRYVRFVRCSLCCGRTGKRDIAQAVHQPGRTHA